MAQRREEFVAESRVLHGVVFQPVISAGDIGSRGTLALGKGCCDREAKVTPTNQLQSAFWGPREGDPHPRLPET